MKNLTTVYNQQNAHFLKSFLEDNDIKCFIFNENFSVIEGGLGFAGIQLKVNEEDFEKATELLVQYNEKNASSEE